MRVAGKILIVIGGLLILPVFVVPVIAFVLLPFFLQFVGIGAFLISQANKKRKEQEENEMKRKWEEGES